MQDASWVGLEMLSVSASYNKLALEVGGHMCATELALCRSCRWSLGRSLSCPKLEWHQEINAKASQG